VAFNGTATAPDWFVRYDTAQEGGNGNWTTTGYLSGLTSQSGDYAYSSDACKVTARFTKFSDRNFDGEAFRDWEGFIVLQMTDCEFYSCSPGGYDGALNITNCLFFRACFGLVSGENSCSLTARNCTVEGGNLDYLNIQHESGSTWPVLITDCIFDGTSISVTENSGGNTNITYCNFNAYLTNGDRLPVAAICHDVTNVISFNWQRSWFGNYYLPPASPLIDHGSTTANRIGLYHFTTQTNQVPEGNSIVDIGYHYVATDANGNPLDTNGDGIPDYLEDSNGDGVYGAGDLGNWLISPYNGLSSANVFSIFTPLK